MDVDGLDCHLVQSLVESAWRPKVWHVEINPLFPPNISLWPKGASLKVETTIERDLSSAFSRRGQSKQALVGCSLQALLDAAGTDYVLVHVEFENAVLVRKDTGFGQVILSFHSCVEMINSQHMEITTSQFDHF